MAEQVIMVDPRVLKDHPRNAEFFDDVQGEEFDRLVESIRNHGVLTPLRITQSMVIISGHQRKRAAIKAKCFSIPAIIDESQSDDDLTMKLIETNFGRMKNDPVKQARWIQEYERLMGVRQGSAGNADPNNLGRVRQEDIAKMLGVSVETLRNLKSLLKLEPAFQDMISEGKINATTGFKLLAKLSKEDQQKLIDSLPDDTKFTASSMQEHIQQIYKLNEKNIEDLKKKVTEKEKEANELRFNAKPIPLEMQERIEKLNQDKRDYYEKWNQTKAVVDQRDKTIEDLEEKLKLAEAKADENNGFKAYEDKIAELESELKRSQTATTELEQKYEDAKGVIDDLRSKEKMRPFDAALTYPPEDPHTRQREVESLYVEIQSVVGNAITKVKGFHLDSNLFAEIPASIRKVLIESASSLEQEAKQLSMELEGAETGTNSNIGMEFVGIGDGNDDDDDFDFDGIGA